MERWWQSVKKSVELCTCWCLLLATCAATVFGTAAAQRRGPLFAITPSELGVHHVQLAGVGPASHNHAAVTLHVFIARNDPHTSTLSPPAHTVLRGYLFIEGLSRYTLNPWGQTSQPAWVRHWHFPVQITALGTNRHAEKSVPAAVDTGLWGRVADDLSYPVPFNATFEFEVECLEVSVEGWLHKSELCLQQQPSATVQHLLQQQEQHRQQHLQQPWATDTPLHPSEPLQEQQQQQQQQLVEGGGWAVWSVLTPFRSYQQLPAYASVLVHYVQHHVRVGFSGVLLYASPSMVHVLLGDADVAALVHEGRLMVMLWDRFSRYQEVIRNQTYYDVPDQLLIINHALLAFSRLNRTALLMGDVDEFLMLNASMVSSVQQLLASPDCLGPLEVDGGVPGGSETGGPPDAHTLPWGAIKLARYNYASNLMASNKDAGRQREASDLPAGEDGASHTSVGPESGWWQGVSRDLQCSPLQTYTHASPSWQLGGGKVILRPAEGVRAWSVHHGWVDAGHRVLRATPRCAHVLHAVNMWRHRHDLDHFTDARDPWSCMFNEVSLGVDSYRQRCMNKNL